MKKSLLLIVVALLSAFCGCQNSKSLAAKWDGTINVAGKSLRIRFNIIKGSDGQYTGSLSSPDQSGLSVALTKVTLTDNKVHLDVDIPNAPGSYDGTLNEAGDSVTGTWMQSGMKFDLAPKRLADPAN